MGLKDGFGLWQLFVHTTLSCSLWWCWSDGDGNGSGDGNGDGGVDDGGSI